MTTRTLFGITIGSCVLAMSMFTSSFANPPGSLDEAGPSPIYDAPYGVVLGQSVWKEGNGNTYALVELRGKTWEEARADMEKLLPGYHLATATSGPELVFISDLMGMYSVIGGVWLGGYQSAPKPEVDPAADWAWVTGEPWEFTAWGPNQPDDAGGVQDYLAYSWYIHWTDEGPASTDRIYGYIAERESLAHHLLLRHGTDNRWLDYGLAGTGVVSAGILEGLTTSVHYAVQSRRDFDGDGSADLLMRDVSGEEGGGWRLWTLVGQSVTSAGSPRLTRNLDYSVVSTDDFDGDSKADVLLRDTTTGRWSMFLMDGQSVKEATEISGLPRGMQWQPVATADFNGDGRSDVLVRDDESRWLMYLMDGATILEVGTPPYVQDPIYAIQGVADFNGDQRDDLLLRRPNGNWFMYMNDGYELVGLGKPRITENTAWRTAAIDDFNGDGNADVLIRNRYDGRWSMTMLNGIRTVDAGLVDMTRNLEIQVLETDDFNGDGRADILMRNTVESYHMHRWVMYLLDGKNVMEASQPDMTKNPVWQPVVD